MSLEPTALRTLLSENLRLFYDDRFEQFLQQQKQTDNDLWALAMQRLHELHREKESLFDDLGYLWALDKGAYNTPLEAFFQWRLLNALFDSRSVQHQKDRCGNIVVRVVPSSSTRIQLRTVGGYHVILLSAGYLLMLKAFVRLWLRGCAIGQTYLGNTSSDPRKVSDLYLSAIEHDEAEMSLSAKDFVGTIVHLLANEVPFFEKQSVFDGEVLRREQHAAQFETVTTAVDGFALFHEVAHVLEGDLANPARQDQIEMRADRTAISLCIVDEARRGGLGTALLGGPFFFGAELSRFAIEGALDANKTGRNSKELTIPGFLELSRRLYLYGQSLQEFLGLQYHEMYGDWRYASILVADSARWAMLNYIEVGDSLADFFAKEEKERRRFNLL